MQFLAFLRFRFTFSVLWVVSPLGRSFSLPEERAVSCELSCFAGGGHVDVRKVEERVAFGIELGVDLTQSFSAKRQYPSRFCGQGVFQSDLKPERDLRVATNITD